MRGIIEQYGQRDMLFFWPPSLQEQMHDYGGPWIEGRGPRKIEGRNRPNGGGSVGKQEDEHEQAENVQHRVSSVWSSGRSVSSSKYCSSSGSVA